MTRWLALFLGDQSPLLLNEQASVLVHTVDCFTDTNPGKHQQLERVDGLSVHPLPSCPDLLVVRR